MKIIFNKQDKAVIKDWLVKDGLSETHTPASFINYLHTNNILNMEMASLVGEYEFWVDHYARGGQG